MWRSIILVSSGLTSARALERSSGAGSCALRAAHHAAAHARATHAGGGRRSAAAGAAATIQLVHRSDLHPRLPVRPRAAQRDAGATPPLPCVSTGAFVAKTVPFLCTAASVAGIRDQVQPAMRETHSCLHKFLVSTVAAPIHALRRIRFHEHFHEHCRQDFGVLVYFERCLRISDSL